MVIIITHIQELQGKITVCKALSYQDIKKLTDTVTEAVSLIKEDNEDKASGSGSCAKDNHDHTYSGTTSTGGGHNHTGSGTSSTSLSSTQSIMPPYYALAYIMAA